MKKSCLILLICIFLFPCCSSKPVMLPGEKKVSVQNIYLEYYNLGEEYYRLKNYNKAIEFFTLSKGHKATKNLSYYKLADCYIKIQKWDEAISIYKDLLKQDSSNYSLKENLAYVYAMKGDFSKALDLYNELFEHYPENEHYVENLIILYLSDSKLLGKNNATVTELIATLETIAPENKNLPKFKEKLPAVVEAE